METKNYTKKFLNKADFLELFDSSNEDSSDEWSHQEEIRRLKSSDEESTDDF